MLRRANDGQHGPWPGPPLTLLSAAAVLSHLITSTVNSLHSGHVLHLHHRRRAAAAGRPRRQRAGRPGPVPRPEVRRLPAPAGPQLRGVHAAGAGTVMVAASFLISDVIISAGQPAAGDGADYHLRGSGDIHRPRHGPLRSVGSIDNLFIPKYMFIIKL